MSRQAILAALETGSMKTEGAALTPGQRRDVAEFLSNVTANVEARTGFCAAFPRLSGSIGWNGWGVDLVNSRFQPDPGLSAAQVAGLKLKWAFGFPKDTSTFGQPAIAGSRMFLGSGDGSVYSLDALTGCIFWTYQAASTVRTAISIDTSLASIYFGDIQANVYSLDAMTGELRWKVQVDPHPVARITGAPKLYAGRLYVPVSSIEEVVAGNPKYACCTFRGSVVALDAITGRQIWKTYTIPASPKPTRVIDGTRMMGPAGAAVWSSPTIDVEHRALYVGTGNAYADPPVGYTDAILSMDLDSGALRWAKQATPGDGWNFNCLNDNLVKCPVPQGPDFDFGASPVLVRIAPGRRLLLAGQKSSVLYALDPDS
jgi:polyvinyl alcohol dehydrogenase (cytochrome)